jgi:signal transduction histidine kinase
VLQGEPLEAQVDRLRIDQAVGNIVDNALRHGGGGVDISLAAHSSEVVEIRVRDHGPGFPPDFLPRAFERFSRPSSDRRDGGSGLGLAIVRTVARAHGGEAHAANAMGSGAEVWLSLPCSGARPMANRGL